ncbi:glycosyltransferase [Gracilibacillus sp. YIM 98692]|uniref:glycosyltransferase n=1 Tax=Gracilibacillus sp. YIM 98692 TaxID=2663532 RepID=UPI0013CF9CE8|nr:glycosyltransferase [Gracilibacillus sp. YIM 98692]
MLFSLLMSVYYKEEPEYLDECLTSILNQTVLPNEIVIVKDGPLTQDLEDVLEKFSLMNLQLYKVIELEENVGLGKALAIGVENCSYDLIARMDSDDVAREDRFEKQVKFFKSDIELDLLGSHIIEFEGHVSNKLAKRKVPLSSDEINKYAKKRNPFNHVTVMYKKEAVLKAGNYRKVSGMGYEDYDLWIRMLMLESKCSNTDDSLVFVRVGKDMYQRRGNKERLITALHFRKNMYRSGFCSLSDYLFASSVNIFVAFIPNILREFIYKKMLRTN